MEGTTIAPSAAFRKSLSSLVLTAVMAAATIVVAHPSVTYAADLGGNCCTDLEDRIAELEATTARKGNRKVSVTVYGVVDEALMHIDGSGINSKWAIGQNSNVESFIGFRGEAVVFPHVKAGYVLELGIGGGNDKSVAGLVNSPFGNDSNSGTYTRRSYGYVESDQFGTVAVGLTNQATDGIAELSTANTVVAARMLSLRPLYGPEAGDALDLFDGTRTNAIRYVSPTFWGANISASYTPGGISGFGTSISTGDSWDIAARWAGEFNGFQALAGVGYREGVAIPSYGDLGSISSGGYTMIDPKVVSGSASVKHMASGLFVNGSAGYFDFGGDGAHGGIDANITAWTIQGGIEQKWIPLGKTTLFGEYADANVDAGSLAGFVNGTGMGLGLNYWGIGAVQHIEAAAADFYVDYRKYDLLGSDADFFMAGIKVDF